MRYTLAVSLLFPVALFAQNKHEVDFYDVPPTVGTGCNVSQNLRYTTSGGNAYKLYGCAKTTNKWGLVITSTASGTGNVTTSATLVNNQLLGGNGGVDIKPVNLSGDVTTSNGLSVTLATVNGSPGPCGDASHISQLTINAKGLVTACTPLAISPYSGTFQATTGLQSTDATVSAGVQLSGLTSGGAMIAVADVAGTAIVYVLPTSIPMSFPKSLQITGTTTCPTLKSGSPATCYATAWQ